MIERTELAEDEVSLQQYLDVIRRRRWTLLYTAVAVLVVGCVATALMTPIYQAEAQLLVLATAPQVSAVNTENPLIDLIAMAQPESVDTQIQVLQSRPFLDEVLAASGAPRGKHEPQIRVTGVRDTNVIDVAVQSADPEMAARVANTMLTHYLEHTSVLSLQEITRAREFVQKEAQKARRTLQGAEDALLEFRRRNRVAWLTAEQQNRTQELLDLEAKRRETHNNVTRVQGQMREVRSRLAREPRERVVSIGHENPAVATLQAKLAEAMVERATLLKSYRPGHLKVRTVDASIASLQAQLAAEPLELRVPLHQPNERYDKLLDRLDSDQTELEGLQAQQVQQEAQLSQMHRRMNQLGPWEVRLTRLQRERDMAEKSYLAFAGKLEDLQIRENARRSSARIIENAVLPEAPVRPHRAINLAVSLLLGLLLGCGLAFLLDLLDDRITTPEEVDRLVGLPVLGHIPLIAGDARLIQALPPHCSAVESYRGLRSSISFTAVDAPLTTLAITSARAAEGKSTTAINLALAMTMDGRQVILVDADLRRPSLHRLLGLRASPGLTDVLTGQCSPEEALQAVPDPQPRDPRLHGPQLLVLTSGPIPPNPAEMLNTTGMENVIRQLRERADMVLFDLPPCLPVTDAQVLGAKLEGVLLVAEMGEARKAEVRRACELLDQAHIRVLGVVFNKISHYNGGYSYRYAYYRSGYSSSEHRNGSSAGQREGALPATVAGSLSGEPGPRGAMPPRAPREEGDR
jgi:polysaccharide biosynthesis transport protein